MKIASGNFNVKTNNPVVDKIAKNTFFNFVTTIIKLLSALVISIIVARLLGPSNFGIYGLVIFTINSIILVSGLGLDSSISRFISEYYGKQDIQTPKRLVKFALKIRIITTIIVFLILLSIAVFYQYYGNEYYTKIIIIIAINLIPLSIGGIFNAIIIGLQEYKYITIITTISSISNAILTIVILFFGYGIEGLLVVGIIISAIQSLISYIIVRKLMPITTSVKLDSFTKRRFSTYSLQILAISFLDMIIWQKSEIFFIGLFRTAKEVGLYAAAYGLSANIVTIIPLIFSSILLPVMSELYGAKQIDKLQNLFIDSTRYITMISIPLCVIGIVLAEPIVKLVYGNSYIQAIGAMRILLFSSAIAAMTGSASAVVYSIEKQDFILKWGIILSILNIIMDLISIPYYGIIGAALSNSTVQLIGFSVGQIIAFKSLKVEFPFHEYLKMILSGIISGLILSYLYYVFKNDNHFLFSLVILSISSIILYVIFLVVVSCIKRKDLELFKKISFRLYKDNF